ncbi:MAG TPA: FecR domain-containing protein, partial [Sorangium sp.]|nr:FecR domain-containing protein [Sorangium sp.]
MSGRPSLDRLRELGRAQDQELAAQDLDGARERFLESATGGSTRRGAARLGPARPRWIAPAAFAALAGVCAALLLVLLPSRSLSFDVGSAEGQVGTWIAAADAPLPVRFSDGTSLALDANARARVVATDAHGARVLLEGGRLTATVTHTATSTWNFDVGPFDVLVTGTRFELSWSPAREALKLVLREGSVAVSGPLVGGPRTVAAGETLEVFCQEQRFELTRGEPSAAAPPPPSSTPGAPSPGASGPAPAAPGDSAKVAKAAGASPRPPGWRDLVAADRYEEAMTAAEAEGFDGLVARASAADLLVLADVARFSGKPERAAAALAATRSRFAG